MVTCKDCIHCEACERMISDTSKMFKVLLSEILKMNCDIKYDSTNILSGAEICQCFQDRSRFVELPCKVGDTVYRICPVRKGEGCNCCPWEYCECHDIGFQNDKQNSIREGQANNFAWILKRLPYFGKIYFITRKAAEQALKEHEANANDLPQSDNHS